MVWAFDCIFLSIHSSYATPHGVVGRGDALVATDMEALTGFGGMGFGGTDIGGGGSWRFVDSSHIVSSKTHPRRGCLSVEKGARADSDIPVRGCIINVRQIYWRVRCATPHGVVGCGGTPRCYRYGSPSGLQRNGLQRKLNPPL